MGLGYPGQQPPQHQQLWQQDKKDFISLVGRCLAGDSASISHLGLVDNQLVFSITKVLDFNSSIRSIHRLSIDKEVNWSIWILDLNIKDYLLSLDALLEVSHSLLESIVMGDIQRSGGFISNCLCSDHGSVI